MGQIPRVTIYVVLILLVVSIIGLLQVINEHQDLCYDLKYQAVGIKLILNDEVYATGISGGFLVGGGFSWDNSDYPENWATLKKLDFKITHIR